MFSFLLLRSAFTCNQRGSNLNIGINVSGRAEQKKLLWSTLEAATSWAVLAAISCEEAMSSSY